MYSQAHVDLSLKPFLGRLSIAHPTFARRNRHADMSSKGGMNYGTYMDAPERGGIALEMSLSSCVVTH